MVGQALVRQLRKTDCTLLVPPTRVDLRSQEQTHKWLETCKPEAIFVAAARVGGILANDTRPGEFIYDNLAIQINIVEAARLHQVGKVLLLGSSCIYPKLAEQPMREEALLTGPLEPTNEWYAIAKIAGLKLGQAYRRQYGLDCICAMPTNLYGPGDNFDLRSSHVLPALLRKFHEAKRTQAPTVEIWGTGSPRREFLHVDDCASALIFMMEHYSEESHLNLGSGAEVTIGDLARLIADIVGYKGELRFNSSYPDGTPRKLLDTRRLSSLGWKAKIGLREGIEATYDWFQRNGTTA